MSHTSGCPRCGVDRLKSAPIPVIDLPLRLLVRRRRYKCSGCGWTGWRRRLRRRRDDVPSLAPQIAPAGRAVGFSMVVLALLLVSGVMLMRSCRSSDPGVIEGAGQP